MSWNVRLDLILLDLVMPGGMDGITACRRLRSLPALNNTPVIFLTGRGDEETMVQAFAAGAADYVLKPFNAQVLLARVRSHAQLGLLSRGLELALAERTRELEAANAKLRRLAIEISLVEEREKKRLSSEIHDSPMQKLGGYGLFSVHERLRLLGGGLSIDSDPSGTCAAIRLPLVSQAEPFSQRLLPRRPAAPVYRQSWGRP